MTLNDIVAGSAAFIDANIFIYHFAGQSEQCSSFLGRIERQELQGFTGEVVLIDVAYRLMMMEAVEQGGAPMPDPAARLARQPEIVTRLSRYYFSITRIPKMGVELLRLPEDFMAASQEFRQSHGLLVNDSLVPMYMRHAGLSVLVSADDALDRVPGIRRFGPTDL